MKLKIFKRPLAMFLCIIMLLNMFPITSFAAGSYGANYPPYSTAYPNTVIVDENGTYIAFQTSSYIYYANDKGYLMVTEGAPVRKMVWKGNAWKQEGNIYSASVPVGRTVTDSTGKTINFHNITNDLQNGNPKPYFRVVDCNVNIINYNITPDSTESINQFSSPLDIANFGIAMLPDVYSLVSFKEGDTFESIRSNFELATSFTIGELTYKILWEESSNKNILQVLEEGTHGAGVANGYQEVAVHRTGVTSKTTVSIPFKVAYVGNPDVYSNIATAKLNFTVEPKDSYGNNVNTNMLWASEINLGDYVDFNRAVSVNGNDGGFNNVVSHFYVGEGDGDIKIESVIPLNSSSSAASFDVYKVKDSMTGTKNGYYNSAGVFTDGNRHENPNMYNVYYEYNGTKHENFYETLYNDFLTNGTRVVIDKTVINTMTYYTIADGRVFALDGTKEILGYWENNGSSVVFTTTEPAGTYIDYNGEQIDIYDTDIIKAEDESVNKNKINPLGEVTNSAISSDEKWVVVPHNTSAALAYAELLVTFKRGTDAYQYRVPFIVEAEAYFDSGKTFTDEEKRNYDLVTQTVNFASLASVHYAPVISQDTSTFPFEFTLYESSGEGQNDWAVYDVNTQAVDSVKDFTLTDGLNNKSVTSPGFIFAGLDASKGKSSGNGYKFKVDINLTETGLNRLNTETISFKAMKSNDITFSWEFNNNFSDGIIINKSDLMNGSKTFYIFVPESAYQNPESLIDISWNNHVVVTFNQPDNGTVTYVNEDAEFTGRAHASSGNPVISSTNQNNFNKAGSTLIGWQSAYYGDEIYYFSPTGSQKAFSSYIVPLTGDTLTAVYLTQGYTLKIDMNYSERATTSQVDYSGTKDFSVSYGTNLPNNFPHNLTRAGYDFLGWYKEPSCVTKVNTQEPYGLTEGTVWYAKWAPKEYDIEIVPGDNGDGGTILTSNTPKKITFEEAFSLLNTVTVVPADGKTFASYSLSKGSSSAPVTSTTRFDKNILLAYLDNNKLTIKVNYSINNIDVIYMINGSQYSKITIPGSVSMNYAHPIAPAYSGYEFQGWFYEDTTFITKVENNTSLDTSKIKNGVITLYGKLDNIQNRNVTFWYYDGDSIISTQTMARPDDLKLTDSHFPANNPTKTGYTFINWYIDSGLTTQAKGSEISESDAVVPIYSKWEANSYDVELKINNTEGMVATTIPTSMKFDTAFEFLVNSAITAKSGFEFVSFTGEDGSILTKDTLLNADTLSNLKGTDNKITITANFKALPVTIVYKYQATLGSSWTNFTTITVPGSSTEIIYDHPVNPTRTGYDFKGWYTSEALTGSPVIDGTSVGFKSGDANWSNTVTLYAKFDFKNIEVSTLFLYYEGDRIIGRKTVTNTITGEGAAEFNYVVPKSGDIDYNTYASAKPGYQLDGWYVDKNLNTPVTDNTKFDSNINVVNVYSKWSARSYDVLVDKDVTGGSVSGLTIDGNYLKTSMNYQASMNFLENITITPHNGYDFDKWYLYKDTSSLAVNTNTSFSESILNNYFVSSINAFQIKPTFKTKNITVKYMIPDGNGYWTTYSNSVVSGSALKFSHPVNPSMSGYNFVGWDYENTTTNTVTSAVGATGSLLPDKYHPGQTTWQETIEVYAKFTFKPVEKNVLFMYYHGNTLIGQQSVKLQAATASDTFKYQIPDSAYVVPGYTFEGWYKENTFENKVESNNTIPFDSSLSVVPVYGKYVANTYEIEIVANDGTSLSGTNNRKNVAFNTSLEDIYNIANTNLNAKNGFKITGFVFSDGVNTFDLKVDSILNTSLIKDDSKLSGYTIYAKYEYLPITINFKYIPDGSSDWITYQNVVVSGADAKYQIPALTPAKGGYTFVNWNYAGTDESLVKYKDSTAMNERILYLTSGTLSEVSNNGSLPFQYGSNDWVSVINLYADFEHTSSESIVTFEYRDSITGDLLAQGQQAFTITAGADTEVTYPTAGSEPEKTGYSFAKWWSQNGLTNSDNWGTQINPGSSKITVAESGQQTIYNVVIYAKWDNKVYNAILPGSVMDNSHSAYTNKIVNKTSGSAPPASITFNFNSPLSFLGDYTAVSAQDNTAKEDLYDFIGFYVTNKNTNSDDKIDETTVVNTDFLNAYLGTETILNIKPLFEAKDVTLVLKYPTNGNMSNNDSDWTTIATVTIDGLVRIADMKYEFDEDIHPVIAGYTYTGWFNNPTDGTQVHTGDNLPVNRGNTVTLYAHYEYESVNKNITIYYKDGETVVDSQEVNLVQTTSGQNFLYIDQVNKLDDDKRNNIESKIGYIFNGYYIDSGLINQVDASDIFAYDTTDSLEIYLKFTPVNVNFSTGISENGSINTNGANMTVKFGDSLSFIDSFVKVPENGYKVIDENTYLIKDNENNPVEITNDTVIDESFLTNFTNYVQGDNSSFNANAIYTEFELKDINVNFMLTEEGTTPETVFAPIVLSPNADGKFVLTFDKIPTETPVKENYDFVKWVDSNGTEIVAGHEFPVPGDAGYSENITIYPVFKISVKMKDVTFNYYDGDTILGTSIVQMDINQPMSYLIPTEENNPAVYALANKAGYVFDGWRDIGGNSITSSTEITDKTTLVYNLYLESAPMQFNVSIKNDGNVFQSSDINWTSGTTITGNLNYGDTFEVLDSLSILNPKNGYNLQGWFIETAHEDIIVSGNKVGSYNSNTFVEKLPDGAIKDANNAIVLASGVVINSEGKIGRYVNGKEFVESMPEGAVVTKSGDILLAEGYVINVSEKKIGTYKDGSDYVFVDETDAYKAIEEDGYIVLDTDVLLGVEGAISFYHNDKTSYTSLPNGAIQDTNNVVILSNGLAVFIDNNAGTYNIGHYDREIEIDSTLSADTNGNIVTPAGVVITSEFKIGSYIDVKNFVDESNAYEKDAKGNYVIPVAVDLQISGTTTIDENILNNYISYVNGTPKNISIYPLFVREDITVTYVVPNSDGTDSTFATVVIPGSENMVYNHPETDPSKPGYNFEAWSDSRDGVPYDEILNNSIIPGPSSPNYSNEITLYARFKDSAQQIALQMIVNGNPINTTMVEILSGSGTYTDLPATVPYDATNEDVSSMYEFVGWYTDTNYTDEVKNGDSFTVSETAMFINVYAKFEKIGSYVDFYIIDETSGTYVKADNVDNNYTIQMYNNNISFIEAPQISGKEFVGWSKSDPTSNGFNEINDIISSGTKVNSLVSNNEDIIILYAYYVNEADNTAPEILEFNKFTFVNGANTNTVTITPKDENAESLDAITQFVITINEPVKFADNAVLEVYDSSDAKIGTISIGDAATGHDDEITIGLTKKLTDGLEFHFIDGTITDLAGNILKVNTFTVDQGIPEIQSVTVNGNNETIEIVDGSIMVKNFSGNLKTIEITVSEEIKTAVDANLSVYDNEEKTVPVGTISVNGNVATITINNVDGIEIDGALGYSLILDGNPLVDNGNNPLNLIKVIFMSNNMQSFNMMTTNPFGLRNSRMMMNRGLSDLEYNHAYVSIAYTKNNVELTAVYGELNPNAKTYDFIPLGNYPFSVNFKELASSMYSGGVWTNKDFPVLGINMKRDADYDSAMGAIKAYLNSFNDEKLDIYYLGFMHKNGNTNTIYMNSTGPVQITTGSEIPPSTADAVTEANTENTTLLFYLENTKQLTGDETISFRGDIYQNDGKVGFSKPVFDTSDFKNDIPETLISSEEVLEIKLDTNWIYPEITTMRLTSSEQYLKIVSVLNSVSVNDMDITSAGTFNGETIRETLSGANVENDLYQADNLTTDYTNSAYYLVDISNPNTAETVWTTISVAKNLIDGTNDNAEFVGYVKVTDNNVHFYKFPTGAQDAYSYEYQGTESNIYPVLRVSTIREYGAESPFGNGLNVIANEYKVSLDPTTDEDDFTFNAGRVIPRVLGFKVAKNTISSFVETIASFIKDNDNYEVPTNDSTDVKSELGDYFFVELNENDTLRDIAHDVTLKSEFVGAKITWTIEKDGEAEVRLDNSGTHTIAHITRNGVNPTFVTFVGTISYESKGLVVSEVIEIPACIPGVVPSTKSNHAANSIQYVGGYIKDGENIKVSMDEALSSRYSSDAWDGMSMEFSIDSTKLNDYSMYVASIPLTKNDMLKGFAVGSVNSLFEMTRTESDPTPPVGSTNSGNWVTIRPNTQGFDYSYIVKAQNGNSTIMDVTFKPIDVNAIKDGETFKIKTFSSESLFLGKYSMPTTTKPFVVMNYGEYVVLMTTSANAWYITEKGLHPMNPSETGTATVEMFVAPDWTHLMTFKNVGSQTVFENLDTAAVGDLGNLIYTSQSILSLAENDAGQQKTIVFGDKRNTDYTRAFKAPGVTVEGTTIKVNGIDSTLYKTSDLTYLSVDKNNVNNVQIYNQYTGQWKNTSLDAVGMTVTGLDGLQRVTLEEAAFVSNSLMPITRAYLPHPYSVTAGSNEYSLDFYVDILGVYHVVANSVSAGIAEEYVLDGHSWVLNTAEELVRNNAVISNISDKYQLIAHFDQSGMSDIVSSTIIAWNSINLGSIPNLPKPPVQNQETYLIYDGEYKIYVNNVTDAVGYMDSDSQEIEFKSNAAYLTCYRFYNGAWTEYPNGDIVPYQGSDSNYHSGIFKGNLIWTNKTILTENGVVAMSGQGTTVFGYYSDGFAHLDHLREGASEKEYFIWDKTSSATSIMFKFNSEMNKLAPLNKPSGGLVTLATNAAWNNETKQYDNDRFMSDVIIPFYSGSMKFGSIEFLKPTEDVTYNVVEDGVSSSVKFTGNAGTEVKMNAMSESQYETNIPDDKFFDKEQLLADTTKPVLDYGYIYQNKVTWVGHDDTTNSDKQVVSGLGEHPYGITFNTFFPYGTPFTAWQLLSNGSWSQVSYDAGLDAYGNPSVIAPGTVLWFDEPIELNVFNYNTDLEPSVTLVVRDEAGNVSDPKTAIIPKDITQCDLKIGELPEDIKKLLEGVEEGNTNDIDAPVIEYIYMYRGQLYIFAQDFSVDGRDVSGLAPYPYMINSSATRETSNITGNANREGTGQRYTYLVSNTDIYVSQPVIPIGEIPAEFTMKIRAVDAANLNGNSGPSDGGGNMTREIEIALNKFSNNSVIYGNPPEDIVKMLEKEKLESGEQGVDTTPPVIQAIYVGVDGDKKSFLGVIAVDNSGSPCEYSFDLRASGTINYQEKFEIQILPEDTGVARIYVRDPAGNETSATVFINASKSEVVYGDPGTIPDYILNKYNIEKTDTVPPVITSVYVYNGKIYVTGYDDVALHATAYGWRPTEDMIINSQFIGVNEDGMTISYDPGNLIPNGTLIFNNAGAQEIQIPMSFEVILRDTSNNQNSMSFFITKNNTCLYGNPPSEIAHLLDKSFDTSANGLIIEDNNRLLVQMHSDFREIKWNEFDYKVQMYDGQGRLVYSVEIDEGGNVYIPYYVAGEDITVVESAIREKDGSELLSKTLEHTTKDTTAPVIRKVYIMSGKVYVDAYDNTALHATPYSFTFENVTTAMQDRFTSTNNKRVLASDRIIVKVRDAAENTVSVTLDIGDGKDKTLMQVYGEKTPLVLHVGDNKTMSAWGDYFNKNYGTAKGYSIHTPENGGNNDMFSFGELDATVTGQGSGFIKLYKDETAPILYIPAKVVNDGESGRTAVVQKNSYSNFLLMFKDKLVEEFGSANGIYWTVETKSSGASKQESFFYTSAPGKYKITATKGGQAIDYWFLVEDDISKIMDTISFESESIRFVYEVGDVVTFQEMFDFSKIENPGDIMDRIIVESISDGVILKDGAITMKTTGRKTITLLNLLNGQIFTMQFQVVELIPSIGDYTDIATSWARSEISLLAQYGILEKSIDKKYKPNNPVSIKEFISYLDKMEMALDLDVDYSRTAVSLGVSTKDWDYYTLNDFAGLISDDILSEILYNTTLTSPITRGQAAVLISNSILRGEPQRNNVNASLSDVFDGQVENAVKHLASLGMVTIPEDGKFNPNAELTRQQLAKILGKYIEYYR